MKITLDKKKSARRGGIHVATATLFAKDFVFENYVIVCLSLITFFRGRPISLFLPNRYQYVRQLPNNVFDNLRQYCNFIAICPKIEAVCLLRTNVSEVHILLHLLTWWFNHVWIIFVMHFKSPKMHTWATSSKKGYDLRGGILNLDKYIGGTKLFEFYVTV